MWCVMRKPCGFKVRFYVACIIKLNEYLYIFTGVKASDNLGDKLCLNKIAQSAAE